MGASHQDAAIIRAGDIDGQGSIYDSEGKLIGRQGESVLRVAGSWDVNVLSPWRKWLPRILFEGFNGQAKSTLYITTQRVVLIREIDTWRELKGEFTALGLPNATAKEWFLADIRKRGGRQYCVIWSAGLKVVKSKKYSQPRSLLYLRTLGADGKRYAISLWKTDGVDNETLEMLESQFRK